jgi:hypothetical protein
MAITALTLALMVAMTLLDAPLKTDEAPLGIVSFELARTLPRAQAILASWQGRGEHYAALGLGLDYLFLVAYSLSIALGCVLLADLREGRQSGFARAGVMLAWAQPGAAVLDAVENYALIQLLLGSGGSHWPGLAWGCAVPKFAVVLLGLLYLILGGALALRSLVAKGPDDPPGAA